MPERRKNRHGVKEWYAVLKVDGKRKFKKCESKAAAYAMEEQARKEAAYLDPRPKSLTVGGLLANYLKSSEGHGVSVASLREKDVVFTEFGKTVGPDRLAVSVNRVEADRFLSAVAARVSGNRANRYRVHIVAAWNWGVENFGLPDRCPWAVEKFKTEEQEPPHVPTPEEFWKVVDAAEDEDHQTQRLLLTYLYTSARKSEVFHMKWSDMDLERKKVRLWTRKRDGGLRSDLVPMSGRLPEILAAQKVYVAWLHRGMMKRRGEILPFPEHVFLNPATFKPFAEHGKLMRRLCAAAEVERFGFHAIRHLSASMQDEANMPLSVIQGMLRHQNATTTSRYLRTLAGVKADVGDAFARG